MKTDVLGTEWFAGEIAASASASRRIFALTGELGAGKTAFCGAFLRALGADGPFTSPTFVIMKRYPLVDGRSAYHIDCYRLKGEDELRALGFEALVADQKNIMLIEWADRVPSLIPEGAVHIRFSHGAGEDERVIEEVSS